MYSHNILISKEKGGAYNFASYLPTLLGYNNLHDFYNEYNFVAQLLSDSFMSEMNLDKGVKIYTCEESMKYYIIAFNKIVYTISRSYPAVCIVNFRR